MKIANREKIGNCPHESSIQNNAIKPCGHAFEPVYRCINEGLVGRGIMGQRIGCEGGGGVGPPMATQACGN